MTMLTSVGEQGCASWQDIADQLNAHFESTSQRRCLLWVDPAQADPLKGNEIVERLRVRVPIRHPRFELDRAPYVVQLDLSRRSEEDLFRSSVELAWLSWSTLHLGTMQGQAVCGWVSTGASPKTVARHWAKNCHLHWYQRQHRLLRFQDPGVREWLWPALSATQQQALLGPVVEIVSINRTQQVTHHGRAASAKRSLSSIDEALDPFPALQIEPDQWEEIDDYAALHAAWLAWQRLTALNEANVLSIGWERPILRALAHASRLGISDAIDRELFALHALQFGPDFYRSPKLDDVWRKTQLGEFYGSAVESLTGLAADQLTL